VAVNSTVIVLIVVVVLLVIALAIVGAMLARRRRSERLQQQYGDEYERAVAERGDRRAAEAELTEREKRHRSLDIRDLEPAERDGFENTWIDIQRGFVDNPVQAVHRADALVVDIMRTRGYPVDDFDRRAEDISVEHPSVVRHYREARATRVATEEGAVDTERQRQAVTSYRALIEALLQGDKSTTPTTREEHTR
jgi:type II secretory pathway pseudopilin PulG